MIRLPRKIKKIAKNCLLYGTSDQYNHDDFYYWKIRNFPENGIVSIRLNNHRPYARRIILFGKKIREAYINGMFYF
jgi:hypothetical protein